MHSIKIECPNGHLYKDYSEKDIDWPEGAPHCPFCCKNYIYANPNLSYVVKLKQVAKIRRILEKIYD